MKIHKIDRTIAVDGLLLAFIFGVVVVSLAQDSLPTTPDSALGWHPGRPIKTPPLDSYLLRVGLSAETGHVPAFFARTAQGISAFAAPHSESGLVAISSGPNARKVSLHLLNSVLLI